MTIATARVAGTVSRPDVMVRLRAGTHDRHMRLHRHPLLSHLLTGRNEMARTVGALQAFLRFYRHLEPRLAEATRFGSPDDRYAGPIRTGWLESDLRRLGHEAAAGAPPRWVREARLADPAVLAGVLYVVEGSASGGRVIARRSSPDVAGLRYFEGHGAATPVRWAAASALIVRLADRQDGVERTVEAARQTFAAVEGCLDAALLESEPMIAVVAAADR